MAHLALPNSELHVGVDFSDHAGLKALVASGTAAVLFPDDDAQPLDGTQRAPSFSTLVVIDGTWSQARKMVRNNPLLQQLPRVRFTPQRPGNYRIRREPEAHCLSTIEAVVESLEHLEGNLPELRRMLDAFTYMVDRQLEHAQGADGAPRRRRDRPARIPGAPWRVAPDVLVTAEANAPVTGSTHPFEPELIQLSALRVKTGETFQGLACPEQPLSPSIPKHLDMPGEVLLAAPSRNRTLEAFLAFLQPGEALGTWGPSTATLLSRARAPAFTYVDIRRFWRAKRGGLVGGVEAAAEATNRQPLAPLGPGRAGRRLAALQVVTAALSVSVPVPESVQ